jgi:predicted  nucleic acid-binding Zn-ribbon protein
VADDTLSELESQVAAYAPQFAALDRELKSAEDAAAKALSALEAAEKEEHELQTRVEEQKQLYEKSVSQLDAVRKPREATAAMTQAEITRRFLSDTEKEMHAAVARVVELRARLKELDTALDDARASQEEQRASLNQQVATLTVEVKAAREARSGSAAKVPKALLHKYDRLRTRRNSTSVFAIAENSCGNCDMAVPIHRRNMMGASGSLEPCEACGVLLYVSA